MVPVVLTVLAGWLLLSVLVTIVIAALARGGQREDRRRGYGAESRNPRPR